MESMTIAGFARAGDVGVETVRYYQRRGLLDIPVSADAHASHGLRGAVRRYGAEDVRRLRFIRAAQTAGFTLDQIVELLSLDAMDDRTRARTLAHQRIAALDAKIAQMREARDALDRLARDCEAGRAGPCPILTAFERA